MTRFSYPLLALLIVLNPCQAEDTKIINNTNVNDLLVNGLIVSPLITEKNLLSQRGEPLSITSKRFKNRFDDFFDEVRSYHYKGYDVIFYQYSHPEDGWIKLSEVEVTQAIPLKHDLKVGQSVNQATETLGQPHTEDSTVTEKILCYFLSDNDPHLQLCLAAKQGIIKRITWSHWM